MGERFINQDGAISEAIRLGDYSPELGDNVVWVWLNGPENISARLRSLKKEIQMDIQALLKTPVGGITLLAEIVEEAIADVHQIFSELASMGPEGTAISADQFYRLNTKYPGFTAWLVGEMSVRIFYYRLGKVR